MMRMGLVITVATAAINFGVIQEKNGVVSHRFVLRNESDVPVRICQTYPSCGCTTISCDTSHVPPRDSVPVDVSFNPEGRGGEFYETASIVVASASDTSIVTLSVEGEVQTSEETLIRQYPVCRDSLWLTTDTLRMGEVRRGASRTMYLGVLRDMRTGDHSSIPVTFEADGKQGWGLVCRTVSVPIDGRDSVGVVITAIVLPDLENVVSSPKIACQRRVEAERASLRIGNKGSAPLLIYRAYTNDGVDLLGAKPLVVAIDENKEMSLKKIRPTSRRLTLITNDKYHPRYVVTFLH